MTINKAEFSVLTFLHDHAEAYDHTSSFNVEDVAKETGLPITDVKKAASFLSSHNLAGVTGNKHGMTLANQHERYLHLTGSGEQFMRELEEELVDQIEGEPGMVKRITVKVAGFVYDAGKAVIMKKLTDWVTTGRH